MSELGPYERMTDQEKREFLRNRTCGPSQPETEGEAGRQPVQLQSPSVQANKKEVMPMDPKKYTGLMQDCGDAPSAAQGTSAAEVAIIKLWAVAKHLNISDPPQPTDLLTAVALVEQAAEWARLHIERRGKENDELREQAVKLSAAQFVPAPLEAIDRERAKKWLADAGTIWPDAIDSLAKELAAAYRRGQKERASWRLVNALEREIIELNRLLSSWVHELNMYSNAWCREIGGFIRRKHHQIDGFVLRTRDALKEAEGRGYKRGQEEMRERAAFICENGDSRYGYHTFPALAKAVRALPVSEEA